MPSAMLVTSSVRARAMMSLANSAVIAPPAPSHHFHNEFDMTL